MLTKCGQHSKEIADYNGWPSAVATRSHMSAIKQGYEVHIYKTKFSHIP